jgi:O-antigen/teichoic acid export membrane protein
VTGREGENHGREYAMRRLWIGLLYGLIGYVLAAVASYFLVGLLSPNRHDRELEAAMTSVFFYGPLVALIAFVVGLVRGGRPGSAPTGRQDATGPDAGRMP